MKIRHPKLNLRHALNAAFAARITMSSPSRDLAFVQSNTLSPDRFASRINILLSASGNSEQEALFLYMEFSEPEMQFDTLAPQAQNVLEEAVLNILRRNLRKSDITCALGRARFAAFAPGAPEDRAGLIGEAIASVAAQTIANQTADRRAPRLVIGHCMAKGTDRYHDLITYSAKNLRDPFSSPLDRVLRAV